MASSVRSLAAFVAAVAPVGGAALPLDCVFETVCFLEDPCTPSDWRMSFDRQDAGYELVSQAGQRRLEALGEADGHRAYVTAPEDGSVAMLTVAEDGTAIYSELSISGGYAVVEYGMCRKAG